MGIVQLKKLDLFVERRQAIAEKYRNAFRDVPMVLLPAERVGSKHAYHLFVIRLQGKLVGRRDAIFAELQKRGVGVQVHYIPIPSQPYYRKLGYRVGDCPKAQAYYCSAISLPMFPKMTDGEVAFVANTVKDVIRMHFK